MRPQMIQTVTITLLLVVAFLIFKNLFSQTDNTEIKAMIKKGAFLVDVRTAEEFTEGSVEGAVNIPLDQVADRINEFKDKKSIVVFCRSGNRSGQAKVILEKNGIKNVFNGGTWQDVKKLVESLKE